MVKEIKSTLESFRSPSREAHAGGAAGYGFGEERALPVHAPFPHEPPTRDPDIWPPPAPTPDPPKCAHCAQLTP